MPRCPVISKVIATAQIIWRDIANESLLIFTTTIPTTHRLPTLMHDPQYRLSIAWQNVSYNQLPHTGFYLGSDMVLATNSPVTAVGQT